MFLFCIQYATNYQHVVLSAPYISFISISMCLLMYTRYCICDTIPPCRAHVRWLRDTFLFLVLRFSIFSVNRYPFTVQQLSKFFVRHSAVENLLRSPFSSWETSPFAVQQTEELLCSQFSSWETFPFIVKQLRNFFVHSSAVEKLLRLQFSSWNFSVHH